jgi:hypothetical protein
MGLTKKYATNMADFQKQRRNQKIRNELGEKPNQK